MKILAVDSLTILRLLIAMAGLSWPSQVAFSQDQGSTGVEVEGLLDGLETPLRQPPRLRQADGEDLGKARQQSPLAEISKQMQSVSRRILERDTSTTTQELQIAIARDLAELIKTVESQQSSRTTAGRPANRAGNQAGIASNQGDPGTATTSGDDGRESLIDAVWGQLPQRLRQRIQSPIREEFLPKYENVIKDYYKRLAEEQQRLRD